MGGCTVFGWLKLFGVCLQLDPDLWRFQPLLVHWSCIVAMLPLLHWPHFPPSIQEYQGLCQMWGSHLLVCCPVSMDFYTHPCYCLSILCPLLREREQVLSWGPNHSRPAAQNFWIKRNNKREVRLHIESEWCKLYPVTICLRKSYLSFELFWPLWLSKASETNCSQVCTQLWIEISHIDSAESNSIGLPPTSCSSLYQ